jgi:O-antigen biosynthesis protein
MEIDKDWVKDYPSFKEITEESLDENNSTKKMLRFIGENKQVLDLGCATGYLAQLLNHKNCVVTGIEINPEAAKNAKQYCKEVIVADLDFVSIPELLPNQEFDVAIFGDVLEHLRNPWKVLQETKSILKKDGFIVASIPNIAHGAIRLALLQGKFEYTDLGILDNTHLRFFTRKTVTDIFESSGYLINSLDYTRLDIFSNSILLPRINQNDFDSQIIELLKQDENSDVLQFIIKALPATVEIQYAALKNQHSELLTENEKLNLQLQHAQVELQNYQSQLEHTQVELQNYQSQLQHKQVELQNHQSQLEHKQVGLQNYQSQLEYTQGELQNYQSQLQQTQLEFERSQSQSQQNQLQLQIANETITAMKSSKFWQMRTLWFKLKTLLKHSNQ